MSASRKRAAEDATPEEAPPTVTPTTSLGKRVPKSSSKKSAKTTAPRKKERDLVNPPIDDTPKEIMSHAERRRRKKPEITVTAEMKEEARERKRELRKHLRMLKSNGARRKVRKLQEKRAREETDLDEVMQAFDSGYRPISKGRRME